METPTGKGGRRLRRIVIAIVVFVTFIALLFAEENWRGKRAWTKYRAGLAARGVELNWHKLAPPPVPDDQNFAMTPFLKPLLDFNPRPFNSATAQSIWRDPNGYNRAMKFADELFQPVTNGWHTNRTQDFNFWS